MLQSSRATCTHQTRLIAISRGRTVGPHKRCAGLALQQQGHEYYGTVRESEVSPPARTHKVCLSCMQLRFLELTHHSKVTRIPIIAMCLSLSYSSHHSRTNFNLHASCVTLVRDRSSPDRSVPSSQPRAPAHASPPCCDAPICVIERLDRSLSLREARAMHELEAAVQLMLL